MKGIDHSIKIEKKRLFYQRIRAILRIEFNAKNKVITINTRAIPVIT